MTYRAQVILPFFTGLPGDVITNTFHFRQVIDDGELETIATAITPMLDTFYTAFYAPLGLAQYIDEAACRVNWYNLMEPEPRQPYTRAMPLTGTTVAGSVMPTEVSCVLSFHGEPQSGIPVARQRGRIYIGGLSSSWIGASGEASFPTFLPSVGTLIGNAAAALALAVAGHANGYRWVVHSPTAGQDFDVWAGWVDNSPDTQRRRSVEATSRAGWTTVIP